MGDANKELVFDKQEAAVMSTSKWDANARQARHPGEGAPRFDFVLSPFVAWTTRPSCSNRLLDNDDVAWTALSGEHDMVSLHGRLGISITWTKLRTTENVWLTIRQTPPTEMRLSSMLTFQHVNNMKPLRACVSGDDTSYLAPAVIANAVLLSTKPECRRQLLTSILASRGLCQSIS
ncbi:hypothetical protein Ae201684P_003214 [Aphanomyces euteiches]|nr:hypothetical protein Ae201684P_003214 [Aphanomyces euteiches]